MSARRPANSVTILKRRLAQAESSPAEAIELASIHDELSRVERKWLIQFGEGSERRKPEDRERLDAWFGRLKRLIEAALRAQSDEPSAALLRETLRKIVERPRQN